jgi:Uma2 family endonuclease
MTRATSRPRKTLADFEALGDEVRAEFLEGEIYVSPSPTYRHQAIALSIGALFRESGVGIAFTAPLDVHLPSGDVVQPDVGLIAHGQADIVRSHIHGVPDLLVEVVSQGRADRDRIVKRALYERNGVPEYWIVDPEERAIEVLRIEGGAYAPAGYFTGEAVVTTPLFEGLKIPISIL